MNLARLNHIFVPTTREGRDRLRKSWPGRALWPLIWSYRAQSDEGRMLSVITLFVGTAGVEVGATQVYLLWATLFGLLLASLLIRPFFRLSEVILHVEAPRRVSAGEPLRIGITLDNRSDRPHHALRVRGPFLPWDGDYLGAPQRVARLGPGERLRREARVRFTRRGPHHLDPFGAAALVPLGLTVGTWVESEGCRFLVLPRPAGISQLSMPTGRGGGSGGQVRSGAHYGDAFELVGVRPYRAGDPVRDLHARTWARTGVPHVRQYHHPRQRRTILVLDPVSRDEEAFEAAVSLAAGVALRLAEQRLDALVVGDEVELLDARRAAVDPCLDHLAQVPRLREGPLLPERTLSQLPHLSSAIVITASDDGRPLELCGRLEQRGIGCKLLRVHGPGLLRRPTPPPRRSEEQVLTVEEISRGGLAL